MAGRMQVSIAAGLLAFGGFAAAWGIKGPKINVADDPSYKEGTPNLVLVEVSDFQCPYCGEAAREVLPKVVEKYVRPGQIELVFLDLPLEMHSNAMKAAEAAACANDQGKFWEMHNILFANQRALGTDSLPGYAEQAGLDGAAFQKCLAGGKKQGGIREDMRTVGFLGIQSTPTLLLGRRVAGGDKVEVLETLHGTTFEELAAKVDALLAAK